MSASIKIFLRVDQIHKTNGIAQLYLRFTINRKKKDIPLDISIIPKVKISKQRIERLNSLERLQLFDWNKEKQQLGKGYKNSDKINFLLTKEKNRAVEIVLEFQLHNKVLNGESFSRKFKNKSGLQANAFEYFMKELKKRKKSFSDETYRSYSSILTKLRDYKPKLKLVDLTHQFILDYINYMLSKKEEGGKENFKTTVGNNLKVIKTFVRIAIDNNDIPIQLNPFQRIVIKKYKGESQRNYITPFELNELEALFDNYEPLNKPMKDLSPSEWNDRKVRKILTPSEHNVLRYFLFCCYTGLRFGDVEDLTFADIKYRLIRKEDTYLFVEKPCIEIDMHKTGFPVMIPLTKRAIDLIGKVKEGLIFNVISNQQTNTKLKSIMKLVKIKKNITFHCSRHTFASVSLMFGIPQKVVQSVLGHQSSATTEIYSHVSDEFVFKQMDELENKLTATKGVKKLKPEPPKETNENSALLEKLISLDADKLEKLMKVADLIA